LIALAVSIWLLLHTTLAQVRDAGIAMAVGLVLYWVSRRQRRETTG
jgi:hypothetical protein